MTAAPSPDAPPERLAERIARYARERPEQPALEWGRPDRSSVLRYGELMDAVRATRDAVDRRGDGAVAVLSSNHRDAALADLALRGHRTFVPLPSFFSDGQLRHAMTAAGVALILTDDPARVSKLLSDDAATGRAEVTSPLPGLGALHAVRRPGATPAEDGAPPARITFTSGTTGAPKGVRLLADTEDAVAASVAAATEARPGERHLCIHPLPVLLETVGGLYRALGTGGTAVLRADADVGVLDARESCGRRLLDALRREQAAVAILVPQLLLDLVEQLEGGAAPAPALRFLGVGGARVPVEWLERAARVGLPAYQGYGLTEACSVACLNTREANRLGTVGRPLPHLRVSVLEDGEVALAGATLDGYVAAGDGPAPRDPRRADGALLTGDFGALDRDGFLSLHGRKSDVICTAYGRNVSASWLEQVLTDGTPFTAARVWGDGLPGPLAELTCPDGPAVAAAALEAIHRDLPGYARLREYTLTTAHRSKTPDEIRPCPSSNA